MPRIMSDPSPTGVVLAGTLRQAIRGHMAERLRHFFLFLYLHRILIARLQALGRAVSWGAFVRATATHQIDSGMRSDLDTYERFAKLDAGVLDMPATAFRNMDAAHYCNLGLAPELAALCPESGDRLAFLLHEQLKAVCGNTRQMPQRLNIGPDRVIDRLHGVLAAEMLDDAPPIDGARLGRYRAEALARMRAYWEGQVLLGNAGVAACAEAYAGFLADDGAVADVWTAVMGNAWADAVALGVDPATLIRRT